MAIPDKFAITNTYILALMFCLPLAGTEELFIFMVLGQVLFVLMVFLCFRKETQSLLGSIKISHPITFYLFLGWLSAISFSFLILFFTSKNGWQTLAAIMRQIFILIQIAFCFSLIRFLIISGKPYIHLLISFGLGFIAIVFIHFSLLYWGPYCDPVDWVVNPFLSPNMRDIADLAAAAVSVFGTLYWFGQKNHKNLLFLVLFTIGWSYLFWTGGRIAIAAAFVVNLLIMLLASHYAAMPKKKLFISCLAIAAALLLCMQLSIYEWNGLVRFTSEWQNKTFNGDISNGRLDAWNWSIQEWLKQPWFGLGPYSFYFIPARFEHQFYHDHPHNLIIQCLIEWGIVGTTLFLALLVSFATIGIKQIKRHFIAQNTHFIAPAGIVLALSISSTASGSYWDYQPVLILVTAFAGFPLLDELSTNLKLAAAKQK